MKLLLEENLSRRIVPVPLALGNRSNEQVARMLLLQHGVIEQTFSDPDVALIELVAQTV